jgi:hypothetical protein
VKSRPSRTQLLAALSDLLAYPSFLAGCFFSYIKTNIVEPNQDLANWSFSSELDVINKKEKGP